MQLDFAPFSYGRPGYGLSEARCVNHFWEPQPGTPAKGSLICRPGLTESLENGTGPVNGAFCADGVFSGDRFYASGAEVYREDTLLGALTLANFTRFCALGTQLVAVQGGTVKVYNGTTFTAVTIPDGRVCVDAVALGFRVFFICSDGRIYWSELGDAADINGGFVTASSSPDSTVGALVVGSEIVVFGAESVEFWPLSSNPEAPINRSTGRTYSRGCASQGSIIAFDNSFLSLGNDRVIYRGGAVPSRISTHDIEARLRACTEIDLVSAFVAEHDGHKFAGFRIPGQGTWVFDAASQRWAEWRTFGEDNFRGRCSLIRDGVTYLGDALSGRLWKFDPAAYTDDGDPIERIGSVKVAATRPIPCNVLELLCSKGTGLVDGTDSIVELRYSGDEGRSWTDWKPRSTGTIGKYSARARWNRLGLIDTPGRIIEFRTTSPTLSAFNAVLMNER
jgi:hypothetical protein